MKIMRFKTVSGPKLGVLKEDMVVDLKSIDNRFSDELIAVLENDDGLKTIRKMVEGASVKDCIPLDSLIFETPIEWPRRILCLGLNYIDHVNESAFERQTVPTVFTRTPTSLVAHKEPLMRPAASEKFDYEAELAVVIARPLRAASTEQALDAIAGYTCCNDGSVRDYQHNTVQWTMGKNFDRSGSIGPWIVTSDELPRGADGLNIQCRLNGTVMQSSNTANMIFKVAETLSYLSIAMTLLPGDIVVTGTPQGVGHARKPPVWMHKGDTVEVEVEGIGILTNAIIDETSIH